MLGKDHRGIAAGEIGGYGACRRGVEIIVVTERFAPQYLGGTETRRRAGEVYRGLLVGILPVPERGHYALFQLKGYLKIVHGSD